jgi:hypothetical protein
MMLRLGAGSPRVVGFLGDADSERFQEVQVVTGEGAFGDFLGGVSGLWGVIGHLIEADGSFEHEEHVEALLADVFDDTCDVLGFGDGLVDRFPKLLDQILDLLIQCHLRVALWIEAVFTSSAETASDYARIGYSLNTMGTALRQRWRA